MPGTSAQEKTRNSPSNYIYHKHRLQDIGTHHTQYEWNITTSCLTINMGFVNVDRVKLNSFKLSTAVRSASMSVARSTLCCWTSQRCLTKCPTTIWQPNSTTTVCEGRCWNGWRASWAAAHRKWSWMGKVFIGCSRLWRPTGTDLYLHLSSSFAT